MKSPSPLPGGNSCRRFHVRRRPEVRRFGASSWLDSLAAEEDRSLYNRHTYMKLACIMGCTLLLSGLGCTQQTRSARPAPAESKTISDGGHTWTLGAATIAGTNVPLTNITVRAITNQAPK